MGKNKGGKVNGVFRVAGGKAVKAKAKSRAQPVITNLKKVVFCYNVKIIFNHSFLSIELAVEYQKSFND